MNQKQPSSGDRTKPRTLLKFVIPTAGLILAFCSMLSFTTCSARHPSLFPWKPSITELDRKAKPHFDQAKKEIPQIARNLSTVSSVTRLCWYMATDKAALEKYLTEQLQPMIRPCANGAAVYGVNMNTTVFHALTADIGKDNVRSTAYAVAGLGMEAVFAKTVHRKLYRARDDDNEDEDLRRVYQGGNEDSLVLVAAAVAVGAEVVDCDRAANVPHKGENAV